MFLSGKKAAAIIAVVLLFLFFTGVRVAHPQDGLHNGLGTANSGLVIYKIGDESIVGSKVLVDFPAPHNSPVLVYISGNENSTVTVQTGNKLEKINRSQIRGHLVAMVPFLGDLLNLFGK